MTERCMIVFERPEYTEAVRLTAAGFGVTADPNFTSSAIRTLDNCEAFVTALGHDSSTYGFVGYTRYYLLGKRIIYLNTVMLDAARQGKGLGARLLRHAVQVEEPEYVSFKTQSARMYTAAQRVFGNVYPSLEGVNTPEDVRKVGEVIASARGGTFPVHKHAYGDGPMYDVRPEILGDPAFYDLIDYSAGDALYCVSRIKNSTHQATSITY